jgi:radical SAM protein with 4Fe4S-binding SPASM domain
MSPDATTPPPARALFEITAKCDLRCDHCLVDGGAAREGELTTAEALDLVDQFADLGIRAVTLTGGEPMLRDDWPLLARRVRERGMILRFSANGHHLDDGALALLVELGCEQFAVSVDGIEATHDRVRHGPRGERGRSSFQRVVAALERLRPAPIVSNAITAVGKHNLPELPAIHALLKDKGVGVWMVQLAHSTGRLRSPRAGEGAAAPLDPGQLLELEAFLVSAARDPLLQPTVHNTIGYMSAQEPVLRSSGRRGPARFWAGCRCGVASVGVEPDGGVKGCANQIGAPFVVGNVRNERLRAIWEDRARWHWLHPAPEEMGPSCRGCALAGICQAGCTALSYGATGHLFDNPYCLRRARGAGAAEGR